MLEKDIQKVIVQWLKLNKLEVSVTDASRTFSKDGGIRKSKVDPSHPDLTVVLPVLTGEPAFQLGLAFYIEVKTPTGTIKDAQKEKLLALSGQGAVAIVARDLDTVISVVKAFRGKPLTEYKMALARRVLELMLLDRRTSGVKDDLASTLTVLTSN